MLNTWAGVKKPRPSGKEESCYVARAPLTCAGGQQPKLDPKYLLGMTTGVECAIMKVLNHVEGG